MFYLFRDVDNDSHIYGEAKTEEEAVEEGQRWLGQRMVWIQCFPTPPTERRDLMEKAEEKTIAHTI